jgi:hypothetical protein
MKKFRITEVAVYAVEGDNKEEAEQAFLNAGSIVRDTQMFVEVSDREIEEAPPEWSGAPDQRDHDNFWIDDNTGERVNAHTGERTPANPSRASVKKP